MTVSSTSQPATQSRAASTSPPADEASGPGTAQRVFELLPYFVRVRIRWAVMFARLVRNYWYDLRRYGRWSSTLKKAYPQENLRALITMDYHRLEKGMALPQPRLGFGKDVIQRLCRNVPHYIDQFGTDDTIEVTINTLAAYAAYHRERGHHVDHVERFLDGVAPKPRHAHGGTHRFTAEELKNAIAFDVDRFFMTRHSIRQFSPRAVDNELVLRAIRLAMESPSVCNRQSWRVHRFTDRRRISEVLAFQDGNRGFGDTAAEVLVVTSDMHAFTKAGERNQCWIDGGMFSMALVLALHGVGLGSCCLNWSVEHGRDSRMRCAAGIPECEAVMMMLAVGHVPEELAVAQSPRRPLDSVVRFDPMSGC